MQGSHRFRSKPRSWTHFPRSLQQSIPWCRRALLNTTKNDHSISRFGPGICGPVFVWVSHCLRIYRYIAAQVGLSDISVSNPRKVFIECLWGLCQGKALGKSGVLVPAQGHVGQNIPVAFHHFPLAAILGVCEVRKSLLGRDKCPETSRNWNLTIVQMMRLPFVWCQLAEPISLGLIGSDEIRPGGFRLSRVENAAMTQELAVCWMEKPEGRQSVPKLPKAKLNSDTLSFPSSVFSEGRFSINFRVVSLPKYFGYRRDDFETDFWQHLVCWVVVPYGPLHHILMVHCFEMFLQHGKRNGTKIHKRHKETRKWKQASFQNAE